MNDLRKAAEAALDAQELRRVLDALECCLEDSAELLNERKQQWWKWRKDEQAQMELKLQKHCLVAEQLRQALEANQPTDNANVCHSDICADADRFRWLAEHALAMDFIAVPDRWVEVWVETGDQVVYKGRTLREAVDRAIAAFTNSAATT